MTRRKKIVLIGAILIVPLIFAVWFLVTGSWFLTRVALPLISERTGVEIVASEVEWHPFSAELAATDLRIGSADYPYFRADSIALGYDLADLLNQVIHLKQIRIDGGVIQLYRQRMGRWGYLPPERKRKTMTEEKTPGAVRQPAAVPQVSGEVKPKSAGKPLQFQLHGIQVNRSRLSLIFGEGGEAGRMEFLDLSGQVDTIQNHAPLHGTLSARLQMSSGQLNSLENGRFQLNVDGRLDERLLPDVLQLQSELQDVKGSINGEAIHNGAAALELSMERNDNVYEIHKLHLREGTAGQDRSRFELTGKISPKPFALECDVSEGRLSPELMAVLSDLLLGFNPGKAEFNCRGHFSYGQEQLTGNGGWRLLRTGPAVFGTEKIELPPVEINCNYDVAVDFHQQGLDLKLFELKIQESNRPAASMMLHEPVKYSWDGPADVVRSARFDLQFHDLDLKLLRFLIPPDSGLQVDSGTFSARYEVEFQHNLSRMELLGSGRIADLNWRWRNRAMGLGEVAIGFDGECSRDLISILRSMSLLFYDRAGHELASCNFSGTFSPLKRRIDFSGRLERLAPELLVDFGPLTPEFPALWSHWGLERPTINFTGVFDETNGQTEFSRLEMLVPRRGTPLAQLNFSPFKVDLNWQPITDIRYQLTGNGDAAAMNSLLPDLIRFEAGKARWRVNGMLSKNRSLLLADGDLALDDVAMELAGRSYRNFSFQNQFSLSLHDFKMLEIKQLNFYLRHRGKPALRLECPGSWEFGSGNYRGEWAVRYFNEQLLALVMPGRVAEALVTGQLQVIGKNNFNSYRVAGAVDCSRWVPIAPGAAPLTGKVMTVLEGSRTHASLRSFSAELQQSGEKLLVVNASGTADLTAPDGAVSGRVEAPLLAIDRMLSVVRQHDLPNAAATPISGVEMAETAVDLGQTVDDRVVENEPEPMTPPRLDFGSRPIDLELKLGKVVLGPELIGELDSRFLISRRALHSEYLRFSLNKAGYSGEVELGSEAAGVRSRFAIRSRDALAIRPLAEWLLAMDQTGLSGTVSEVDTRFEYLADGRPEAFLRTLSGRAQLNFSNLVIPNRIAQSVYARLLLFPVDIISYLGSALPTELGMWRDTLITETNLTKKLEEVRFQTGEVQIRIDQGAVLLERCRFSGDLIRRLYFDGSFLLYGEQPLQLTSRISAMGGQLTIPIGGTLSAPTVKFSSLVSGAAGDLLRKLKELSIIGLAPVEEGAKELEPVIMIDELPSAGTIREVKKLFEDLFQKE